MPQIFHRSANTVAKVTIFSAVFILVTVAWVSGEVMNSPYVTQAFIPKQQPIQFSHKHHSNDDGIDCRYCHTSVEYSASAGIPSTKTCMNCHSQLFKESAYLALVRESWQQNKPIIWTRVHDLPDFVYFNHSIHLSKGVGCSTCHGRVDLMPLTYQYATLQMQWCLNCHRNPEKFIRPVGELYNMEWQPPPNQEEIGRRLMKEYQVRDAYTLSACSTCHR